MISKVWTTKIILEKHQFFTWLRRLSGLAVWAFSPLTMSNRSLSAPDLVTSNMRRMQLRHFWEVCHEFLLSALPVLTSKLPLMKALIEPDFWLLTQRGYICMPSWLTVTCVFVLESLLEEPAASRFCNGSTGSISRQNEGDIGELWIGLIYVAYMKKENKVCIIRYHCVCVYTIAASNIFSVKFGIFISMFSASMPSI